MGTAGTDMQHSSLVTFFPARNQLLLERVV